MWVATRYGAATPRRRRGPGGGGVGTPQHQEDAATGLVRKDVQEGRGGDTYSGMGRSHAELSAELDQYRDDLRWFNQDSMSDKVRDWAQQRGAENPYSPEFETQQDHAKRLRGAREAIEKTYDQWLNGPVPAGEAIPGTAVVENRRPDLAISDRPALLRREPGKSFNDDPLGRADLPARTPRSPEPGYAPPQQSLKQWVDWLRSRGIEVDHTLQRPDAARPRDRAMTGPEIWHPLVDWDTRSERSQPDQQLVDLPEGEGGMGKSWTQRAKDFMNRRRASVLVTDYIEGVLVEAGER